MLSFSRFSHTRPKKNRKSAKFESITKAGGSPDEKIFTPTDERGFFPYTLHPTPHTPHPTPHTLPPPKNFLPQTPATVPQLPLAP
ncbi:MAG: hypothetical protein O9338_09900 [Microcystis sp. LE19-251.1A]|nr:hypothetical protein [Microcystis sp. LE19-251.1A]